MGIEQTARLKGWSVISAALGAGSPHERALKAVEFAAVCRDQKVGGVFFHPLRFLDDDESFNRALRGEFDDNAFTLLPGMAAAAGEAQCGGVSAQRHVLQWFHGVCPLRFDLSGIGERGGRNSVPRGG